MLVGDIVYIDSIYANDIELLPEGYWSQRTHTTVITLSY